MNPEIQGQKPRWDTNRFTCFEFINYCLNSVTMILFGVFYFSSKRKLC
jgi:hypothetical protein